MYTTLSLTYITQTPAHDPGEKGLANPSALLSRNLRLLSLLPRRSSLRSRARRRTLLYFLFPRHSRQPIEEQCGADIEADESPHDAEVAPSGVVLGAQLRQVYIRVPGGAEFALRGGVGIEEVAAAGGSIDIRLHIVATGLAAGWVESEVFNVGAGHLGVGKTAREHAVDEVSKGRDPVHEDPEPG